MDLNDIKGFGQNNGFDTKGIKEYENAVSNMAKNVEKVLKDATFTREFTKVVTTTWKQALRLVKPDG